VMLYTPQGIFRLPAEIHALASWAEAVANLPPAVIKPDSAPNAPPSLPGIVLRATDESGNAMRLLRLSGDSAWPYHLSASNGAWEYGERVSAAKASLLLLALSGRDGADLTWEAYSPTEETRDPAYRPATMAPDNPRPRYPPRAELRGLPGAVRVQFTIGSDGRVRPETLLIVRSTHPLFALAVRNAIPSMRFAPATRNGIPIEDIVFQEFQFRSP
jgi:TonB family protein